MNTINIYKNHSLNYINKKTKDLESRRLTHLKKSRFFNNFKKQKEKNFLKALINKI